MSSHVKRFVIGLLCTAGCAGPNGLQQPLTDNRVAEVVAQVESVQSSVRSVPQNHPSNSGLAMQQPVPEAASGETNAVPRAVVRQIDYRTDSRTSDDSNSREASSGTPLRTLSIDGVSYLLKPVNSLDTPSTSKAAESATSPAASTSIYTPSGNDLPTPIQRVAAVAPDDRVSLIDATTELPVSRSTDEVIPLNLPSVLSAIDNRHPIVGQAQWRVQQAYAGLDQAHALWLPSIQAGFSFHRHDGNYQASNGDIVDVHRSSFQYGLGMGATGAGTTNARPGIVAQFHLADAIFRPKVVEKRAWASGHAANAVLNAQLLSAAIAYFNLLDAHQDLEIVEQSRQRFAELTEITVNFAEAGEGLNADADRLRTELALIESRRVATEERVVVAAARLAQAISLNGNGTIVPTDVNAVPLDFVPPETDAPALVAAALRNRPELKESQALVAAACEAYRREKHAPFVPSVLLGFSTGGFGGGLGNDLDNIEARYDFDALFSWEIRNLGLGERGARREQSARVQQARYEKLAVMDQVAREVTETQAQVQFRRRQIDIVSAAIQHAEESYRQNLERIRDGQGLPLEVLQSIQALETTQRAYLRAIIDYNQAQIQLQWTLGFPIST